MNIMAMLTQTRHKEGPVNVVPIHKSARAGLVTYKRDMDLQGNALGWDEPLTDQELRAIEVIEATFQSSSSLVVGKRHSDPLDDQNVSKSRRQLPKSFLADHRRFSLSSCQANLKMRYPAMRFGGNIIYTRTKSEVEKAASELLNSLKARKKEDGRVAVGFDIEWKPTFKKGASPGKSAVMQLCASSDRCDVMHIIHSGIPHSLQLLLEDSTISKVGVGISNDCVKVFKDCNVSINAVEDLSILANKKLGGDRKIWSLASLSEMLVCKELQKPTHTQLGNWEVHVLSMDQLRYAATDAFASWHLYQVLQSFPDSTNKNDESESLGAV